MYVPKQWLINNLFTKTLIDKLSKTNKKPFDSQYVNIECYLIDTQLELGKLETSYDSGNTLFNDALAHNTIIGTLFNDADTYYLTSVSTYEVEDYKEVYLIYTGNNKSIKVTVDGTESETFEVKEIEYVPNERPVDFIITADLDLETDEITNASASLADVLAVAGAVRNIVFILHAAAESGGTTVDLYDRYPCCDIANYGSGNGVVSFSKVEKDSGTPLLCSIIAASGDHDGNWVYDEVKLAAAQP